MTSRPRTGKKLTFFTVYSRDTGDQQLGFCMALHVLVMKVFGWEIFEVFMLKNCQIRYKFVSFSNTLDLLFLNHSIFMCIPIYYKN